MYRVIVITVTPGVVNRWAFMSARRSFFKRSFVGAEIRVVALDTAIAW
jgi:hypothetical protein